MKAVLKKRSPALLLALSVLLGGGSVALASPEDEMKTTTRSDPLTERERCSHLLARLAFGPRPGDVEMLMDRGWKVWFEEQLEYESIPDEGVDKAVAGYETLKLDGRTLLRKFKKGDKPKSEVRNAIVIKSVMSERQLFEVLVGFWRNHFSVDADKGIVNSIIPAWDRDVIRNKPLGNFRNMLKRSAQHPAMLEYLDNVVSQRPPTPKEFAQIERMSEAYQARFLSRRGLNENYARELLELHSLGVDNYYKQRDVRELARILTGWTFESNGKKPLEFMFNAKVHDFDTKKVLRIRVPKKGGVEEGIAVINALSKHKGVSEFISWKLCRYLVTDFPPKAMVKDVALIFRRKKANIKEVIRAIVYHPLFFDRRHFRVKFKSPLEFCFSAVRAVNGRVTNPEAIVAQLRLMSQPLYNQLEPTGYFDQAEAWQDPGCLVGRWRFALALTRAGGVPGIEGTDAFYKSLLADCSKVNDRSKWPEIVAKQLVPAGLSKRTLGILKTRAMNSGGGEQTIRSIAGLILGSPEFQQQ